MRKVLVALVVSFAWAAMSLGASAPGLVSGSASIDVTQGVVGTTVTVTGNNCGQPQQGLRANGTVSIPYQVGSGVLIVTVPGWPEPFASGYEGGTNDVAGGATATFQVPDVPPGVYPISVECQSTNPVLKAGVAPYAIGPYPPGLSFTVVAPTVPVIEAQATTTG